MPPPGPVSPNWHGPPVAHVTEEAGAAGVISADATDALPVPTALIAATLKK